MSDILQGNEINSHIKELDPYKLLNMAKFFSRAAKILIDYVVIYYLIKSLSIYLVIFRNKHEFSVSRTDCEVT